VTRGGASRRGAYERLPKKGAGVASTAVFAKSGWVGNEIASAEALLREIATELVSLPLDERARPFHLRVLALKQVVSAWSRVAPPEENVDAMLDTLRALRAEVLDVRATTSEVRLRSTAPPSWRAVKTR
jgi:hypothetical protein